MEVFNLSVPLSHLGEGPVWDNERQGLWWVDIEKGDVLYHGIIDGKNKRFHVGQFCSAVALSTIGKLIITVKDGFAWLDPENGSVDYIIKVEGDLHNNRFNDGKCDPAGRFWAGTMDFQYGTPGAGSLYRLNNNLTVCRVLTGVTCSNGLAWSADHSIMYYIDTLTKAVMAFDYDNATGELKNKRVVINIAEGRGLPDGMTIDREGMLWIALWGGGAVARYDPASGSCISTIHVPASNVTSCTFGGSDLQDLYITTARVGLNDEELSDQPLAGGVFVARKIGVAGVLPIKFAGGIRSRC